MSGSFEAFENAKLEPLVRDVWTHRQGEGFNIKGYSNLITEVLKRLTLGKLRVAEPDGEGGWKVNQWAKEAVLLSFSLYENDLVPGGPDDSSWFDKVGMRSADWSIEDWENAGFRAVPGSLVRNGAFVAKGAVLMPSFVNIGSYVGKNTMIDTWATVGACAQIGANVHLSGGAGIGGVLEPMQDNPVIIEDGCFIGARSEIVEGLIVREGAAIGMGVVIGKDTPIIDRTKDGEVLYGEVPAGAVVLSGFHPKNHLVCPQIVKYRDEKTDAKTALNMALRNDMS